MSQNYKYFLRTR